MHSLDLLDLRSRMYAKKLLYRYPVMGIHLLIDLSLTGWKGRCQGRPTDRQHLICGDQSREARHPEPKATIRTSDFTKCLPSHASTGERPTWWRCQQRGLCAQWTQADPLETQYRPSRQQSLREDVITSRHPTPPAEVQFLDTAAILLAAPA